jgi:hypothetical protein
MVAEELEPLAAELRRHGYQVELTDKERFGRGVTWWEVFNFVVDESTEHAIEAAVGVVTASFVAWARKRFKSGEGRPAPKAAKLYGPDGSVLKTIEVKDETSEPEVKDDET